MNSKETILNSQIILIHGFDRKNGRVDFISIM